MKERMSASSRQTGVLTPCRTRFLMSSSEPALDLIDPRRRSRREVDVIMRPLGEPRLDLGDFVGGIVIHDEMDIEPFGDLSVDQRKYGHMN
jgi:hypothetical protein